MVPRPLQNCSFPHEFHAKFVGTVLQFTEGDDRQIAALLARAHAAFASNRTLLCHADVPCQRRLKMFDTLVTSTIRWLLCTLAPLQASFRKLRVTQVTLASWMLRVTLHFSNPVLGGISHSRHAVKLWLRQFSQMWNSLHAEMIWGWAGHTFRRPQDLTSWVLRSLVSSHRWEGARRVRRGQPARVGQPQVLRFLASVRSCGWMCHQLDWVSSGGMFREHLQDKKFGCMGAWHGVPAVLPLYAGWKDGRCLICGLMMPLRRLWI